MKLSEPLKHQLLGVAFQVLMGQVNDLEAVASVLEAVAASIRAQVHPVAPDSTPHT